MVNVGMIGLGKMGLSHLAILGAHEDVNVTGICDPSSLMTSAFKKHSKFPVFSDYRKMLNEVELDAIVIAAPTRLHKEMVDAAVEKKIGIFLEKPMSLTEAESLAMKNAVEKGNLPNQVGYHNRFIQTFCRARELISANAIGEVYHVDAESYGPVVIRESASTWRSDKKEGGGCLFDYASHVINLLQYCVGSPEEVRGTVLRKVFSSSVEDAVYSTLLLKNASCQLSVNWSDETHRKMSTSLTVYGKQGKIMVDAHEIKVYSKSDQPDLGLVTGFNMENVTGLAQQVNYHLRGEEYSDQIDHFVRCVDTNSMENRNSFAQSYETEKVIDMLSKDGE